MCKTGIETRIAGLTVLDENNIYASTVGRESKVYGPLRYETFEVTFDMTGLDADALNSMRWRLVGRVLSYLNAKGYPEAAKVNWRDVPYVGPGMNMGYISSSPEVKAHEDHEETVAITHSGSFIPNLKFRFRVPEERSALARVFGKPQREPQFYSDVKSCLYLLAAESKRKEKALEVCAA